MPSLLVIQWLVVGFFVLIHFLLGMKRGTLKSAWFLLAYVVTAVLTFVLIANVTLAWFFKTTADMEGLLTWANGLAGGALNDFLPYLTDPTVLPVIFMILDLIVKIILYVMFFPIIRWLLTLIVFKPIWKHIFLKRMLDKQNTQNELDHEASGSDKKYKKQKKLKISFMGRLSGGLVGAVRGFLVAFVFLLPILVFGSFIAKIDTTALTGQQTSTNQTQLAVGDPGDPFGLAQYADYLNQIKEMDQLGLGQLTRQITVDGASFDRYVFDSMFTPTINDGSLEKASVNFIQELENIVDVATIILNNGYQNLTTESIMNFTDEDINNIQLIIEAVGRSDLLSYVLSTGLDKAPELIPQYVTSGPLSQIDWDSESLQDTLAYLVDTDWHEEFNRVSDLIGLLGDFMSPAEINALLADPASLATLETEQVEELLAVVDAIGRLHLLAALNIGIEYAITLPDVQSNIAWSDDPAAYLQEKLSFILDDPEFFIGEDGQLSQIADLIGVILLDETSDIGAILGSAGDLEIILANQSETLANALFQELASMDIIVNGLPIGVDILLYQMGGEAIADELAGDLAQSLSTIDWEAEIINIGDIYATALSLSLETLLSDNPDMLAYADSIILNGNHVDSVRHIVSAIFEDSDLVGQALDVAAPYIIDQMITDDTLKEVVQGVVLDENDDFDFNVGAEINSVLTILEEVSTFTTFTELGSFGAMELNDKLNLIADFGGMPQTNYANFRTALTGLQFFSRVDENVMTSLVNYLDLADTLYVPTEMLFSDDIGAIIDLGHDVARYYYTESVSYDSYEDIDLTNLLPIIKDDLLSSEERSDFIFYNLINQAQKLTAEGSLSDMLTMPDSLSQAAVEDAVWETEMTALIGAVFDIATSIGKADGMSLSTANLQVYGSEPSSLPLDVILQYADLPTANQAFSSLDSSLILRASIPNLIDSQGEGLADTLFGYVLSTPHHLVDEQGLLDVGVFTDLINGFALLLDDMNQTLDFTMIGDLSGQEITTFVEAFNLTNDASIEAFMGSELIRGIISDMLTDQAFQQGLADTLNGSQETLTFDVSLFAVDPVLLDPSIVDAEVLLPEEAANFLIMLKALQLTDFEFTDIGLDTFTALIDRNIDQDTGKDDFDRFLGSGYIYSVIEGILRMDQISTFVSDQLSTSLSGVDMSGLDFTLPNDMLGQQADADLGDIDPIEVGRLPKDEFRRIFNSIGLIDFDDLGINTFTGLVSPVDQPDDFTTLIESDFIYFILATLFDNPGFSDYIGSQLGQSFGESLTLDMAMPSDAKGTQAESDAELIGAIEVNRVKRSELRNIMISFSMLDIENDISVGTMLSLFTTNAYISESVDPNEDKDNDFYQFLDSKFLQAVVSQILLSDTVIDMIAGTDGTTPLFDSVDFSVPSSSLLTPQPDAYERLTKDEIFYMFNGFNALGITNFDDIELGLDTIKTIDDEALLKSDYLYEVLHLVISNQASLTIPLDAIEDSGVYNQMIIKDEIHKLFVAFNSLPDFDPNDPQLDTLTSEDITTVINTESLIINQMISDKVVEALAVMFPTLSQSELPEAFEDEAGIERLKQDEMLALVASLEPLGATDLSVNINTDNLDIAALQDIHALGLGDTAPNTYDSYLLQYLISDAIGTNLSVPTGSLLSTLGTAQVIHPDEIDDVITALLLLADDNDPLTDDSETLITSFATIDNASLTREKINSLLNLESLMIDRIVAEGMINVADLVVENAYAVDGDINFDPNAPQSDIKRDEMRAIVAVMDDEVMDITNIGIPIETDNVTIGVLQSLHDLGMGTGTVGTELYDYDSYIIHHLISQSISDVLSATFAIPSQSVDTTDPSPDYYLVASEIQRVIDAILVIEDGNTNAIMMNMTGNINDKLTPSKLKTMLDYDSRLIDRMIGSGIITANLAVDESYLPFGHENYDGPNLDLYREEMYAIVAAIGSEVLDLTTLDDLGNFDSVSIGDLQSLHALGMGTGLVGVDNLDYDSYILHNIISESLRDVLSVTFDIPTSVVDQLDPYYIDPIEIQSVIDAILLIEDGNTSAQLTNLTGNINNKLTPTKLQTMLDYDKRIVDRMIATGIITANLAIDDAYLQIGDTYYDGPNLDIYRDEMYALVAAMGAEVLDLTTLGDLSNFDNANIAQLQALHDLGKGDGLVGTNLLDYDSFIIHNIISKSMDTVLTFDIPALAVTSVTPYYIDAVEIQAVIDALSLITGGVGDLSSIGDAITSGGLSRTNIATILGYDKRITDRMIANGIITANQDVPQAYIQSGELYYEADNLDLDRDEMFALTEAMLVIGVNDLTDPNQLTASSIGPNELDELNYLGLGTDPFVDVYQSYMVQNMLTTGVSALSPSAQSLDANGYIEAREVEHLAETLRILGINNVTTLSGLNAGASNFTGLSNEDIDYIAEDGVAEPHYLVYEFLSSLFGSGSRAQLDAALTFLQ